MKLKYFLFIILLTSQFITAQTFQEKINDIFENVDLNQVPSGILKEYGLEMANDSVFNGTINDENKCSPEILKLLYSDMWSGEVTSTSTMPSIAEINQSIENNSIQGLNLISVLNYNYHRLKPNTLSDNLMTVSNEQLFDVPNRTKSPYQSEVLFAASSNITSFIQEASGISFFFDADAYFSNSAQTIQAIYIDGGDGDGYQLTSWNNNVTFSYSSDGIKNIKVKFILSNGTILYSHFDINVKIKSTLKSTYYYNTESLQINQNNVRSYNGDKASGEVTIIYSGSSTILDKPLIILEGYDTWKIIPGQPDFTYNSLLNESWRMGYLPSSFQSSLRSRGYDIVFVNYDNGTDYIQRNAYFVQEVIKEVNRKKTGSHPNAVMGISMGGLVGRYALSDMEQRSELHDVELFVTMDSPHRGANVPLGLQAMVRHTSTLNISIGLPGLLSQKIWDIEDIDESFPAMVTLLQEPATRQMLISQLSGFGEGIYVDNSIHNSFMAEYNQLGMPKNCRNVAISNGTGNNNATWQFTPGGKIVQLSGTCKSKWYYDILSPLALFAWHILPDLRDLPFYFFLPGANSAYVDYQVNSYPEYGSGRVYNGKIQLKKKILWVINASHTVTSKTLDIYSANTPWSSIQGGYSSFDAYTNDIPEDQIPDCIEFTPPSGKFCFVPLVSALDINRDIDYLKGYDVSQDLYASNFDNFYTEPVSSRSHTEFNAGNTDWVLKELDKDATLINQSLLYKFNNSSLTGDQIVCSSGNDFTVENLPEGVDLIWEHSSNLTKTIKNGTTATFRSSSNGEGWIKATLQGGGITVETKERTVWVGVPKPFEYTDMGYKNYMGGELELCAFEPTSTEGEVYMYVDRPDLQTISYNWIKQSSQICWYEYGNNRVTINPCREGFFAFTCQVSNQCGMEEYEWMLNIFDCDGGGEGGGFDLMMSPNPASVSLNINVIETQEAEVQMSTSSSDYDTIKKAKSEKREKVEDIVNEGYDVIIWHEVYGLVKKVKCKKLSEQIDISSLKPGKYYVHMITKKQVLKKPLIIK